MIALTLPCEVDDASRPPFVARLRSGVATHSMIGGDAHLVGQDDERVYFQLGDAGFSLPKGQTASFDGDVLFVEPAARRARRWIRARSPHNTLLVTENCDQLCQMCSQPPKRTDIDLYVHFEEACALAPAGAVIGISGGEPTLYKDRLFSFLSSMAASRPDLKFHVLTNAQHFAPEDRRCLRDFHHVLWGVPIYAADAALHDGLVGKEGAFARLLESFAVLAAAGAAIELRTVVMRENAGALGELGRFVVDRLSFIDFWALVQLERTGFAKNRWADLFFDHSVNFESIADALSWTMLHGIRAALYNFPYCTVPEAWRPLAARSISDWKNKYLKPCEACPAKPRCSGFFEWHLEDHGYERFAQL